MPIADLLRLRNEPFYQVEEGNAKQVSKNLDQLVILEESDPNAVTAMDLYEAFQKTIELMNHPFRREKVLNNRDAIIAGNYRLPTQNTLTTLMRDEENTQWNIWNIFSLVRARKNVGLAKNKLLTIAPKLDINKITFEDIEFVEGSGIISIIQSGGLYANDSTIQNTVRTILHAHQTFDYERISIRPVRTESDMHNAIKLSLQAIQPMYNEVLVYLNRTLGPIRRK